MDDDYIAVAVGDEVKAVCETVPDSALLVRDWRNLTRGVRFRSVPSPTHGVAHLFGLAILCMVVGRRRRTAAQSSPT